MSINQKRLEELNRIRSRNGGVLRPSDVVEFARNADTALHSAFTWDDDEAGQKWRLHEARNLIRVMVTIEDVSGDEMVVRPFISLPSDRRAGGYRATVEVMGDEEMRAEMLSAALAELRATQKKYRQLQALSKVFAAIDEVAEVSDEPVPSRLVRAGEARQVG